MSTAFVWSRLMMQRDLFFIDPCIEILLSLASLHRGHRSGSATEQHLWTRNSRNSVSRWSEAWTWTVRDGPLLSTLQLAAEKSVETTFEFPVTLSVPSDTNNAHSYYLESNLLTRTELSSTFSSAPSESSLRAASLQCAAVKLIMLKAQIIMRPRYH